MERTLAEKSYDYIRRQLTAGRLPPGTRLVNRVLADEIGVSVIPVREAIHRLASEGLIEHVPGAGAFVREIAVQELDDLYVLRDALESCAAGEAAQHIAEHQLDELESILEESRQLSDKIEQQASQRATKRQMNAWLDIEQRFHELLMEASRNPLLAKVAQEHRAIGQIFDAQRGAPQLLTAEVAAQTCVGKLELLEAFRQRNPRRARELMSAHIQRGRKRVLGHLRRTRPST